jgi:uncharacterized phage protein (TIGR01671 family)
MIRPIKFRAWDRTRKQNSSYDFSYDTYTLTELLMGRCKNPNDYDNWEEFTGLLDKNGKEIYEGDILKTIDNEEFENEENVREVIWSQHDMRWNLDTLPLGWGGFASLEIIGNIYENPELL